MDYTLGLPDQPNLFQNSLKIPLSIQIDYASGSFSTLRSNAKVRIPNKCPNPKPTEYNKIESLAFILAIEIGHLSFFLLDKRFTTIINDNFIKIVSRS